MLSLCLIYPIWFTEIMCLKNIPCIEELINDLETENADAEDFSSEDEDEDQIDPAYLHYLHATYQELFTVVEEAGGELTLNNYSRFLLDELYIGRFVSPYYFNLGLDMIYEQ